MNYLNVMASRDVFRVMDEKDGTIIGKGLASDYLSILRKGNYAKALS